MAEFNPDTFKEEIEEAAEEFTKDLEAIYGVEIFEVTYQIAYAPEGEEQGGVASGSTRQAPERLRNIMLNEALKHRE